MKRIFPFMLFAILVAPFHAQKFPVPETRSKPEWHFEKTSSNPIFRQDDEYLFPSSDFEMGDWTGWKVVSGTAWINTPSGCAGAPNNNFFSESPTWREGTGPRVPITAGMPLLEYSTRKPSPSTESTLASFPPDGTVLTERPGKIELS